MWVQSDLACESFGHGETAVDGADWRVERIDGFAVGRMRIESRSASNTLQKPCGNYVTIECGRIGLLPEQGHQSLTMLLANELRGMSHRLTGRCADSDFSLFVVGLGNDELTADAIGPRTARRLTATRHLQEHENALYRELGCSALSVLAPGVLGQTGIETQEIVRAAVEAIRPHLVLAIDALAARECARLATTVQLTDTGISPGSGVGNHRAALTKETLGVPVMSIGVPTVVNSATLVWDALRQAGMDDADERLSEVLENGKSFFVSPKDSDVITAEISSFLSAAIGMAFCGGL